ncbi:MAG: glycosyltransferase family 39 protein [Anaerolineae bacterium]|nr:glycosyltransferase family 39 protein [Anaerolineae bacterium]
MSDRPTNREWIVVVSLILLSLLLRLVGLGAVPPGVRFDELVNVKMADHVYAGEWPIYFQEAWGHEPLYHYLQALGMWLLGETVLGVRVGSALMGVLGVLAAYVALRRLYGRAVASLAALLLATSLWSLMYSRIGLRHISLTPWVSATVYCLWRGLEAPVDRRRRVLLWFGLAGASTGIALHTYFASRVLPAILIAFLVYMALVHRRALRGRWWGVILLFVVPALMVTPMALYLRDHPELEQRLGQVSGGLLAAVRTRDLRAAGEIVLDTLAMFSVRGDPEWLYNISGRPVFDPLTSIPFYVGIALAVWRWREPRHALLLLWLLGGISPSLLSWPAGSLGHTIVAQPAAFGFAALGLAALWRWAARRRARTARWGTRALVASALVLFVAANSHDYFYRWPRFREVRHEYQAPVTAVARYLQEHAKADAVAVSAPYVDYWNPWSVMNFRLYAPALADRVRWFDGAQSLLLAAGPATWVFLPEHLLLPSDLHPELDAILRDGAGPAERVYRDRIGDQVEIYLWEDREALDQALDRAAQGSAWASAETTYLGEASDASRVPLRFPIAFGERLSLLGYRYARDDAAPGETWELTTYWAVTASDPSPLALFLHVLDDQNAVRAGWDGLYVSTESWATGDLFIHRHALALPSDLPSGVLRVEVGVYSPVTLARLPVLPGDGSRAPHDRALLAPLDTR